MGATQQVPAGRRRVLHLVLAALAVLGVVGVVAGYVGYRVLFAKNPEVVQEIRQAEETQRTLDDIFAKPIGDAAKAR